MKLLLMALHNLGRNRRRTLLSLLVVGCGAASLVLTAGFIRFSFAGLQEAIVQGGLGDLEVTGASDLQDSASPIERSARPPDLPNWQAIQAYIESRPDVRGVGATIQFAGVVTRADRSAAFLGIAVEADRERQMGMIVKLRQGEDLVPAPPHEGEETALIGVGLARALAVVPGDVVTLVASTPDGSLDALDVSVSGLITTGLEELDSRILKVHVLAAQRLLGTDKVSSLVIALDRREGSSVAAIDLGHELRKRFAEPLRVRSWEERAPFYRQVRSLYGGIFIFLGSLVFLLVVLSTSSTLLMSVLERVREFGTLRAIGTSRYQVASLVVLEALWLGLLGGCVGAGLGWGAAVILNALEIRMPPPPGAADPIDLALLVEPLDLVKALVFMVLILVVASLLPALRVVRLRVAEALAFD